MSAINGIMNISNINKMDIKIRFNTLYPNESIYRWRLIVDGVEHLVHDIEINCKTYTTEDEEKVPNPFNLPTKECHISCKAKKLSFSNKKNQKKAIIL
jgi:hypothetical protein